MVSTVFAVTLGMTDEWMKKWRDAGDVGRIVRYKLAFRETLKGLFPTNQAQLLEKSVHSVPKDAPLDDAGMPVDMELPRKVAQELIAQITVDDELAAGRDLTLGATGGCCHWEGKVWRKCQEFALELKAPNSNVGDPVGIEMDGGEEIVPVVVRVAWDCKLAGNKKPAKGKLAILSRSGSPQPQNPTP